MKTSYGVPTDDKACGGISDIRSAAVLVIVTCLIAFAVAYVVGEVAVRWIVWRES